MKEDESLFTHNYAQFEGFYIDFSVFYRNGEGILHAFTVMSGVAPKLSDIEQQIKEQLEGQLEKDFFAE